MGKRAKLPRRVVRRGRRPLPPARYRCAACEHEWQDAMPCPTYETEWESTMRSFSQSCPRCGGISFEWLNYADETWDKRAV